MPSHSVRPAENQERFLEAVREAASLLPPQQARRVRLDVLEQALELQTKWPQDAPITQVQLRAELAAARAAAQRFRQRMRDLYRRMPPPLELRLVAKGEDGDQVPASIYQELRGTVAYFVDEGTSIEEQVDNALAWTPQKLIQAWLERVFAPSDAERLAVLWKTLETPVQNV